MASSHKALLIAAAAMAVVMGALLPATAWPENNHVVGEFQGWGLGVDYTNWARVNDGIPVGDTLEFIYPRGAHNVVLVTEDNYNTCVVPNNALTWSSGDDRLQPSVAGKYFFICGVADHCAQGMKLAINVI